MFLVSSRRNLKVSDKTKLEKSYKANMIAQVFMDSITTEKHYRTINSENMTRTNNNKAVLKIKSFKKSVKAN